MLYVIADRCSKDTSCVQVCPVAAIHPTPDEASFSAAEQLYIDPAACIDCGACAVACPLDTIYADHELPETLTPFIALNAEQFVGVDHVDPDDVEAPTPPASMWERDAPRVAIVGSGPSALYAACALIERGIEVSIFERLPTPFGLIRSGVAPDHPQTRDVARLFRPVLDSPLVHWYLGVEVGTDLEVDELLQYHHAVLWATGAAVDRPLGIPGENLRGSYPAREFVSWYNGHPDFADRFFDLATERAVIIGNGNVALDVARLLTRPATALEQTAMPGSVLDVLRGSAVRHTVIVGRQGPVEAAFTTSELLALDATHQLQLRVDHGDLSRGVTTTSADKLQVRRQLIQTAADASLPTTGRSVDLRFFLTPVTINGAQRVESVTFMRNELIARDGKLTLRPTGHLEVIDTGLVFLATGARGEEIAGLPFDAELGRLPNIDGSIVDPATGATVPGQYCVGWIKRGATGALGTNRQDAAAAVENILTDFHAGNLREPFHHREQLDSRLNNLGHRLDLDDWRRIDQAEQVEGARTGRARATLHTKTALLAAAADNVST